MPTAAAVPGRRRWAALLCVLTASALVVSRLIDRPRYLYYFDNVNFALAIKHFDPRLHQPQPPGYPLFVALLKLLNGLFHDPNRALIISGLIGSALGLAFLWIWASGMFGKPAGWIAVALLIAHPVFWLAGIANPVRTFLVVIVAASAALGWRSLTRERPLRWFYGMSAALGLMAGFRPECLLLLFPLWIATGLFRKIGARSWLAASTILCLATLAWLAPLIARMGGAASTYRFFIDYLGENSRGYTWAFGATVAASLTTVRRASIWNFSMTIAWLWAVPLAWRTLRARWSRAHSLSLLCSFVPPFLFHAFVHVRNVDQTLISIPALCVVGGAVMASVRPRIAMTAGVALAVLFSGWNYLRPMFSDMDEASRETVRRMNDATESTMAALQQLRSDRDALLLWDDSNVTWRQVAYYFPADRLLDLRRDIPEWITSNDGTPAVSSDGAVMIPGVPKLVMGVSDSHARALLSLPGAERLGPLLLLPWRPAAEMQVGPHRLRALPSQASRFVPIAPCRIVDTPNANQQPEGLSVAGGTSHDFAIRNGACKIPANATAYSFHITVTPHAPLGFVTLWPAGQTRPVVATLAATDQQIRSNGAIIAGGTNGAISLYSAAAAKIVLDLNGYFVPADEGNGLDFYPLAPCRVAEAQKLAAARTFTVRQSSCGIPEAAQAYSLNVAAAPRGASGGLTIWPTGKPRPADSTITTRAGLREMNTAIVPAGGNGSLDVYATAKTEVTIDVNGYFAPPASGGLSFYSLVSCRVLDTRLPGGSPPFRGNRRVDVRASGCGAPASARAYVLNATVVPSEPVKELRLSAWNDPEPQATGLCAADGSVTSNLVFVQSQDGAVDAFASNPTHLVLDLFGYFAP